MAVRKVIGDWFVSIWDRIGTAIADIGTVDGKVDGVETKVDTAITDIAAAEAKVDTAITDIGTVDGKVDDILADTNELELDWKEGGRLDNLLDAASAPTVTEIWETNISAYAGAGYAGTYLKMLYDDWLNGGRLDLLLDAIPTTPTLQATWTDAKAAFLDENISAAKTLTVEERTAIRKSVCLTGDTADSIGKILFDLNARVPEAAATEAKQDIIDGKVDDILLDTGTTLPGEHTAIETKVDTAIAAISPLGGTLVSKAITFTDLAVAADLFTVTGDAIVRIIAVVKTNCASAGACNAEVGIAGDTDAILPTTDVTLLAAQEIWHDATPGSEIEALVTFREYIITNDNDIIITPSAQIDSGAVTFYCFWTALSSGATVVAA